MKSFLHNDETMEFTAPSGGVTVDVPVLIGALLVIPKVTVAQALPFAGLAEGVFTGMPKAAGSAWTEGEALYWDNSAKNFTVTSTSNTLVGIAVVAALSGDTTGQVRLPGIVDPGAFVDVGQGVQDIVLGTTAPDGLSEHLFVSTTGTKTDVVPNGKTVGQKLSVNQYAATGTPIGTLTGAFKDQAGVAKTTLALGTATGKIGGFVWDGTGYRLTAALTGTGSGLT